MLTILSFIIVLFGALNWLSIGFFQYDIVAGLFGFQGSIFSRIVYIIIGISGLWLTYAVIRYKGRLTIKKSLKNEKKLTPNQNNDQQNNNNQQMQDQQNQNQNNNQSQNNNNNFNNQTQNNGNQENQTQNNQQNNS